jgi:hypothetical protein
LGLIIARQYGPKANANCYNGKEPIEKLTNFKAPFFGRIKAPFKLVQAWVDHCEIIVMREDIAHSVVFQKGSKR